MFVLITISNTRSKRVNENITRQCTRQEKNLYMQIFMLVGVSIIEILLFNRKKKKMKNSVKISITYITPVLQAFLDFFPDIISFQHVPHLDVGRSQIEWKLKVKTEISLFP